MNTHRNGKGMDVLKFLSTVGRSARQDSSMPIWLQDRWLEFIHNKQGKKDRVEIRRDPRYDGNVTRGMSYSEGLLICDEFAYEEIMDAISYRDAIGNTKLVALDSSPDPSTSNRDRFHKSTNWVHPMTSNEPPHQVRQGGIQFFI